MKKSLKRAVPFEYGIKISIRPAVADAMAAVCNPFRRAAAAVRRNALPMAVRKNADFLREALADSKLFSYLCSANLTVRHYFKCYDGNSVNFPDMPASTSEGGGHSRHMRSQEIYQAAAPEIFFVRKHMLDSMFRDRGRQPVFLSLPQRKHRTTMKKSLKRAVPFEYGVKISIRPAVADALAAVCNPSRRAADAVRRNALPMAVSAVPVIFAAMLAGDPRTACAAALAAAFLVSVSHD